MKKIKYLIGLSLFYIVSFYIVSFIYAAENATDTTDTTDTTTTTLFGTKADYNPSVPGASDGLKGTDLLKAIKNGINWVLGILAFIALIVLLWGGFQMVTAAGNDEKYKKGFTILKQAAIGLIFIGLSWFIVSLIFAVIGKMTS